VEKNLLTALNAFRYNSVVSVTSVANLC